MTTNPPKTAMANFSGSRHRGRVLALQVLYEVDLTAHPWESTLKLQGESLSLKEGHPIIGFAGQCVAGVMEHWAELDGLIGRYAPTWPVAQLALVDRNILRLALFELIFAATEPPKVVINEAVELAKAYGGENSSRFINGVLGAALTEEGTNEGSRKSGASDR
jgi:N utilization substance protein B